MYFCLKLSLCGNLLDKNKGIANEANKNILLKVFYVWYGTTTTNKKIIKPTTNQHQFQNENTELPELDKTFSLTVYLSRINP